MITYRWVRLVIILTIVFFLTSCSKNVSDPIQLKNTETPPGPTSTTPILSLTSTPITPRLSPTSTPSDVMKEKQVLNSLDSQLAEEGIQGWAVLIAKEDYSDSGDVNLDTGFLNLVQLLSLLKYSGWQE